MLLTSGSIGLFAHWLMSKTILRAAGEHPDQIAILNFIKKAGKDVTVRDVEKSRFGGTPWFKAWLQKTQPRKDKVITERDVRTEVSLPPSDVPRNIVDEMVKSATTRSMPWNDEYSILSNNRVFALVVPETEVERLFSPYGDAAVRFMKDYNQKAQQSGHPVMNGMVILAWVRYSELDDGTLWVHEVQTDLPWAVGARHITRNDVQEAMSRGGPMSKEANMYIREVIKQRKDEQDEQMTLLNLEVFKEFVNKHYDRAHRIVFPTMKYRLENYPADLFGDKAAPASIYNDLPRKLRFEKTPVENLTLPEEAPPGEVWVFASTVVDFTERLKTKREAQKQKAEEYLADMHQTMMSDPGFQQEARRAAAKQKMAEHAAGPQKFQRGDRVRYSGNEGTVPADWLGRVVGHEWHTIDEKSPTGEPSTREHLYIVKWYNPKLRQYHEGLYSQDELSSENKTMASVHDQFAQVSRAVRGLLAQGVPSEVLKAASSIEVDALVKAVAADQAMSQAVLARVDGRKPSSFGIEKLQVLASESGSAEAKKLLRSLQG